jgi:hypothetical protein
MLPVCPKCNRPETQFVLVGFICRHPDCHHFFSTPEATKVGTDFLVERYTGNNPENKPGLDGCLDDADPTKTNH